MSTWCALADTSLGAHIKGVICVAGANTVRLAPLHCGRHVALLCEGRCVLTAQRAVLRLSYSLHEHSLLEAPQLRIPTAVAWHAQEKDKAGGRQSTVATVAKAALVAAVVAAGAVLAKNHMGAPILWLGKKCSSTLCNLV